MYMHMKHNVKKTDVLPCPWISMYMDISKKLVCMDMDMKRALHTYAM